MPIVYEDIEDKSTLSDKEKKRLKERRTYAVGKRQLRYNERNHDKIKEYLSQYYLNNKDKWARKYGSPVVNSDSEMSETKRRSAKVRRILASINESKKNPPRCRVTIESVKTCMEEILIHRCNNYINKTTMKKKIMCIVGESGVGKTLASLHLQNHLNANVICSFTSRPARETEVEGREHHFYDIDPPKDDILAFAIFGKYKYYALKSQVFGPCTVYVVDEAGVKNLIKRHGDEFDIYTVNIIRSRELRLKRGIDVERMQRDKHRDKMENFDYVVVNESTKTEFFKQIENIYNEIIQK